MTKGQAKEGFVHYGERIYTPLGNVNKRAQILRAYYAHIYSTGHYKKIRASGVDADKFLIENGCPCGFKL